MSSSVDEHFQMSETEVNDSCKEFCSEVVRLFGGMYLNWCPTDNEKQLCLARMKRRGFPGLFASWDCKHFRWANCPVVLAGQHLGKQR